jgi:beta-mannanase
MKKTFTRVFPGVVILLFCCLTPFSKAQLKSMVYDFDGLDIGSNDLPEGDYCYGDLTYQISANPLSQNDMLGDRVVKLNVNWSANYGSFGRGISRFIEFDPVKDIFNFYFYNPSSNGQNAVFTIMLGDDDNQNGSYENTADDVWKKSFTVPGSSTWQLYSVPLSDFVDGNTGGNGTFDIAFSETAGKLCQVEFQFVKGGGGINNPSFYLDMISFSEGSLPRGASDFDLPPKQASDYCLLGAFMTENTGENYKIPVQFESMFPVVAGKKLKYVNFFTQWATDGTTNAHEMPGTEVQTLINNGYTPIITWEPMFQGYDRLDPAQPRLNDINSGIYDGFIDSYADKIKLFTDTVIIRFMHEFEGDWYPWALSQNGGDPSLYKTVFQKVVNRFRARGVTNVQWMWCVNSDYSPVKSYNWIVNSYPGDAYVDIIASDIYNNHYPVSLPWWKSFRWQAVESYYYLAKYFPQKPLYICEVGCRERYSGENTASQSKGDWYAVMDKELQSNFRKARALVFFNGFHEQDWFVNSSSTALQSLIDNIWNDGYYFNTNAVGIKELHEYGGGLYIYPNPSTGIVTINYSSKYDKQNFTIDITNTLGSRVYSERIGATGTDFSKSIDLSGLRKGIYYVRMEANLLNNSGADVAEVVKLIMQ